MRRRVIKQGHNTLTMTLPSTWTKKLNISAGDELELEEKQNGLFLTTEKKLNAGKRAEFDITDMDIPTIWKYFMSVYREGYDEVRVYFDSLKTLDSPYKFYTHHKTDPKVSKLIKSTRKRSITTALQGFVDRFIGFEIVEHGKDYILIKDLGGITSKEFDNSLRRVFLLLQQMAEEVFEAIVEGNTSSVEAMHDIDINLDKFHDYCIRVLNKIGNKNPEQKSLYFATLFLIEMIGDEFKNIAIHLIQDFSTGNLETIKPLVKFVKEQIDNYYDLFYKFDKEKIKKISELDQKTYMDFPKLYRKANEEEKEVFHHLRMVGRYINSLLEIRIEMEY
jgi:phosphate uptake regulator